MIKKAMVSKVEHIVVEKKKEMVGRFYQKMRSSKTYSWLKKKLFQKMKISKWRKTREK